MKKQNRLLRLLALGTLLMFPACRTVHYAQAPGSFSEVSPAVANEMLLDTNQVVVFDVRSRLQFRGSSGHIAGAISTPFESIEQQLPELLPYQNNTILVYGETSTDGATAAKLLSVAGFRNVVHVDGGLEGWIAHGFRTVNAQ